MADGGHLTGYRCEANDPAPEALRRAIAGGPVTIPEVMIAGAVLLTAFGFWERGRLHAQDLIARRLVPAEPRNDGKQTPYRGHPVFVAQHATATCCRSCLERWHQIPRGRGAEPRGARLRGGRDLPLHRTRSGGFASHHVTERTLTRRVESGCRLALMPRRAWVGAFSYSGETCLMSLAKRPFPGADPVTSEGSSAQAGVEKRKVSAARARRRCTMTVAFGLTALAAIWLVPAFALRPMANPAVLAFPVGFVVAMGLDLMRGVANARSSRRLLTAHSRYLTASTWTGLRTIDLRGLKRVRARRISGRLGKITYLQVTDTAGVRIAFSAQQDIETIRRALEERMREQDAEPVKVSRLARGVLGIQPLPGWISALWTLASIELIVLIMLGCAFTVITLA